MKRPRRGLPVLAEVAGPAADGARPGALRRSQLDAFNSVLGNLGQARSLLVTGAAAGKRTVAMGLAAAAVAAGRRAALLECDLIVPSQASSLGLAAAPGLHEYLRCSAEAAEILQPLVLAGPGAKGARAPLVCVTAGEPATDAAALLLGEGFGHAVAKLLSAYDLLILDGPPLAEPEPALLVAAQADAALCCVPSVQTAGKAGKGLRTAMRNLPTRSLGLLLCD